MQRPDRGAQHSAGPVLRAYPEACIERVHHHGPCA
jgi:hypothetical protein